MESFSESRLAALTESSAFEVILVTPVTRPAPLKNASLASPQLGLSVGVMDRYEELAGRIPPGLMPGKSVEELAEMLRSDLLATAEYIDEHGRRVYLSGAAAGIAEKLLSDEAEALGSAGTVPSGSMAERRASDV